MALEVVGVFVAAPVPLLGHEAGWCVAEMKRHRVDSGLGEIVLQLAEAALEGIRLRRKRQVHAGLGERVVRLGHPDEMRRLLRGARDHQRLRISKAHVLTREDDDPARDEHRVLARVDHAHEPVERRVGVGATNALDERRDGVVVLVAGPVVEERAALERLAHLGHADRLLPVRTGRGRVGRELERVQRDATV